MSELDDVLEHFGVKGMKWGVRNDKGHEGEAVKVKKLQKLDQKFEKNLSTTQKFFEIYNAGAKDFNANKIDSINAKPAYKKAADAGLFLNDNHPITKKYHKEVQDAFVDSLNTYANSLGSNPSGTKRLGVHILDGEDDWSLVLEDIKHAAENVKLKVAKAKNGIITAITLGEPVKHYGVKGMHWGVRKSEGSTPAPEPHPDFVRGRELKTTGKKTGTKALSNDELRTAIERMNLERQFNTLAPTPKSAATKFIVDLLGNVGKQQTTRAANDFAAKKVAKALSGK
jgi:hypothetical protein